MLGVLNLFFFFRGGGAEGEKRESQCRAGSQDAEIVTCAGTESRTLNRLSPLGNIIFFLLGNC